MPPMQYYRVNMHGNALLQSFEPPLDDIHKRATIRQRTSWELEYHPYPAITDCMLPQAQDRTFDLEAYVDFPTNGISLENQHLSPIRDNMEVNEDEEVYLQVSIPTSSNGLTTFSYQQALRTRIHNFKLTTHGEYDTRKYTPTFVHDSLMLPGSLANLLGKASDCAHASCKNSFKLMAVKVSPADIIRRMTPALLPGFHAYVHSETELPCLLQSCRPRDYVQGMLILGQGSIGRNRIHKHYRPHARRVKVEVEIDVIVSVHPMERDFASELYRLQRRKLSAHVWLWSNADCVEASSVGRSQWTLENYLGGNLEADYSLRIEPSGKGVEGDDGEFSIADREYEVVREKREVVYGGPGSLDYERAAEWTGW